MGWLVAIVTFPGVIIHEWAHKLFCDLAHVPVHKTLYFRLGNPAGYVVHGPVHNYGQAVLITTAPFIVNTLVAALAFLAALNITHIVASCILYWFGIAVAMHSFPSREDAGNLWHYTKNALKRNPLVLLMLPLVGILKLAGLLKAFWFDLLYSIALLLLIAYIYKGGDLF
jgi:hypothetical protein